MFEFELVYHKKQLHHKPRDGKDFQYVLEDGRTIDEFVYLGMQSRSKYINKKVSIKEFYKLALLGHTWKTGHYIESAGNLKKESVDYVQIVALDFDKITQTPQEMVELARSYGCAPNFWYYSFSQGVKTGYNFRLVWVLEEPVEVEKYEDYIITQFMEKFALQKPDKATKDASRLFYGTCHGGELIKEEPLSLSMVGWLHALDKVENNIVFSKAIRGKKDFTARVSNLPDHAIVVVGPKWHEELKGNCWLWDQWVEGKRLSYKQRLTLFTGLSFIKHADTSRSIAADIMSYYNPEAYEDSSFDTAQLYHQMRSASKAVPICKGDITIPEFFNRDKPFKPNLERTNLEIVEKVFRDTLPEIMEEDGMNYVEVQTAMGKTEEYIKWALTKDLDNTKIVIAAPTYSLLHELKDRILRRSPHLEDKIYLPPRSDGLNEIDAFNMIHGRPSKSKDKDSDRHKILRDLIGYNGEEEVTYKKSGIFLVSHAILSNLINIHHTDYLIIDENIENNVIYNQTLTLDNLLTIKDGMQEENHHFVDELVNEVMRAKIGQEINKKALEGIFKPRVVAFGKVIESGNFSFSKFREKQLKGKACPGLFYMKKYQVIKTNAEKHEITIHGRKPLLDNALEYGVKIKLFCATPQFTLLEKEYPRCKLNTFGLARNKGRIIQYTGISGAKGISGLEHIDKYMQFVEKTIGKDVMVITHKAACKKWEEAGFIVEKNDDGEYIHLGNNAGLDRFYGRSIAIVGKLELSEEEYKKQWAIYKGDQPLPPIKNTSSTMYGIEVRLRRFDDDFLSRLQNEHVNMVVSQAAGRARALRAEGATVYVFGNFILKEADEVYK